MSSLLSLYHNIWAINMRCIKYDTQKSCQKLQWAVPSILLYIKKSGLLFHMIGFIYLVKFTYNLLMIDFNGEHIFHNSLKSIEMPNYKLYSSTSIEWNNNNKKKSFISSHLVHHLWWKIQESPKNSAVLKFAKILKTTNKISLKTVHLNSLHFRMP